MYFISLSCILTVIIIIINLICKCFNTVMHLCIATSARYMAHIQMPAHIVLVIIVIISFFVSVYNLHQTCVYNYSLESLEWWNGDHIIIFRWNIFRELCQWGHKSSRRLRLRRPALNERSTLTRISPPPGSLTSWKTGETWLSCRESFLLPEWRKLMEPDVSLRLALSIWTWCRYRETPETDRQGCVAPAVTMLPSGVRGREE